MPLRGGSTRYAQAGASAYMGLTSFMKDEIRSDPDLALNSYGESLDRIASDPNLLVLLKT